MAKHSPFHPDRLDSLAIPEIRPAIGVGGALVWRYTLLFPIAEGQSSAAPAPIQGAVELFTDITRKLAEHFRGLTILPLLQGYGLRDANDPASVETNVNCPLLVYAAPISASDRYFETLQEGVGAVLKQGLVLLERQEIFLLGSYYPGTMSFLRWLPWHAPATANELPPADVPPST